MKTREKWSAGRPRRNGASQAEAKDGEGEVKLVLVLGVEEGSEVQKEKRSEDQKNEGRSTGRPDGSAYLCMMFSAIVLKIWEREPGRDIETIIEKAKSI